MLDHSSGFPGRGLIACVSFIQLQGDSKAAMISQEGASYRQLVSRTLASLLGDLVKTHRCMGQRDGDKAGIL